MSFGSLELACLPCSDSSRAGLTRKDQGLCLELWLPTRKATGREGSLGRQDTLSQGSTGCPHSASGPASLAGARHILAGDGVSEASGNQSNPQGAARRQALRGSTGFSTQLSRSYFLNLPLSLPPNLSLSVCVYLSQGEMYYIWAQMAQAGSAPLF